MDLLTYYANLKLYDTPIHLRAGLKAVSKERPRFSSRSGHAYTPERTREFENKIAALAKHIMGHRPPYTCPVKIMIMFVAEVPKSWPAQKKELALAGLIVPSRGDLDNQEKAVCDALNGIAFTDDVLIGSKVSAKQYGYKDLITVTIERNGLSDLECQRWIKMQKDKNDTGTGGGGAKLG